MYFSLLEKKRITLSEEKGMLKNHDLQILYSLVGLLCSEIKNHIVFSKK